nr:MAG TPA: hypothetical protein [Caudoviricetes sp.]
MCEGSFFLCHDMSPFTYSCIRGCGFLTVLYGMLYMWPAKSLWTRH